MPKFQRRNKKRIDPRYFLNETVDRDGPDDDAAELLDITRDMLISQIRQGAKDLYGRRDLSGYPEDLEHMSLGELEDILFDQAVSPEQRDIDDSYRDKEESEMGVDSPEDKMPKHQGFGRRPGANRPWPKRSE